MAKALLGHVCGPNQLMAAELRRLRQRIGDLEARLARLQEEREAGAGQAGLGSAPSATETPAA